MFSLHKVKQQRVMQENYGERKKKEEKKKRIEGACGRVNGNLAFSARERFSEFSRSLSSEGRTGNFEVVLKKGTVPLSHPLQHQFRQESKSPGIYLRQ